MTAQHKNSPSTTMPWN